MEQSEWYEVPDFSTNVEGRISMHWRLFDREAGPPLTAEFLENPIEELGGLPGVDAEWRIETTIGNHQFHLRWRKGRIVAILLHEQKQVLLSIVKLAPEPGDAGP